MLNGLCPHVSCLVILFNHIKSFSIWISLFLWYLNLLLFHLSFSYLVLSSEIIFTCLWTILSFSPFIEERFSIWINCHFIRVLDKKIVFHLQLEMFSICICSGHRLIDHFTDGNSFFYLLRFTNGIYRLDFIFFLPVPVFFEVSLMTSAFDTLSISSASRMGSTASPSSSVSSWSSA